MAAQSGKGGLVTYKGAPVLRINSWSLNVGVNQLDITSWSTGTDQWRDFTPGLSDWSGDFNGFWDVEGSTAQEDLQTNILTPATGTVILEIDKVGGAHYTGGVYLSQLSASVALDGTADVSYSFQGTGTLTYATTT